MSFPSLPFPSQPSPAQPSHSQPFPAIPGLPSEAPGTAPGPVQPLSSESLRQLLPGQGGSSINQGLRITPAAFTAPPGNAAEPSPARLCSRSIPAPPGPAAAAPHPKAPILPWEVPPVPCPHSCLAQGAIPGASPWAWMAPEGESGDSQPALVGAAPISAGQRRYPGKREEYWLWERWYQGK